MTTLGQNLNLSSKQKELVAVGASIGSGCHPCVDHHLRAGEKAGLDSEPLPAAVTSAERVAAEATVAMGDHVRGTLAPEAAPALLSRLEEALASLGAAVGANDRSNIERQLKAALDLGASRPGLEHAIETARRVQENAARIHSHEAERLLDALETSGAAFATESDAETAFEFHEHCGCGAARETNRPPREAESGQTDPEREDKTATDQPSAAAEGHLDSPAAPGTAGAGMSSGCLGAMAAYRRMFDSACRQPAAPAETNEAPAEPESTGPCTKEV